MIDGRGRARLTDFGLAVEQQAASPRDRAGTALYMSPEQLAGREVSSKSDLYALGLIFYEMLSGRRFFDAHSAEELDGQHRSDPGPRLSLLSGQVDPAFRRLVAQCLEEDPKARPASARSVLASLPGGDPLEAAIAAGQTPAPDVVAGAGPVGDLGRGAAWAGLAALAATTALVVLLQDRASWLPRTPPPKTAEVLVERARGVLSLLGHAAAPADWAGRFEWDDRRFRRISLQDRRPDRFDRALHSAWSSLSFAYRQSPEKLVAANRSGVVDRRDPPADKPGMAEVVLDPQGRLRSYLAVPPQVEAGGPWPDPDWSTLFREAQLESAAFRPVAPEWSAPVDSDRKAAWEGPYPGMPDTTVRIEAAAYHGRPVWFALLPPWAGPEPGASGSVGGFIFLQVSLGLALAGGAFLVRRNLRLGRGDQRGSLRLALVVFASYAAARLLQGDHVSAAVAEFWLLIKLLAYPMAFAALIWTFYLALEPYARRQWPRILISWGRLLAGRWRDPMVGRDVLLGAAAGALIVASMHGSVMLAASFGAPQVPAGWNPSPESLTSWRSVGYRVLMNVHGAALWSIVWLFLLVLLSVLLRRKGLALAAWGVLFALTWTSFASREHGWAFMLVDTLWNIYFVLVHMVVLTRLGLLGFVTAFFVAFVTTEVPLTFDGSLWWAPRGWAALAVVAALGVYGFRTALAGKTALGRDWLEA
jgi:serine/threonine-protein kinase